MSNYAPSNPRYTVSLGDDGSFIVWDRRALHNQAKRWLPAQFVSGQGAFDERTNKYPDYVHGKLWALHDIRSRARLDRATRAARVIGTTNVTEGRHVTLCGRSVESHVALVEHVTL